MVRQISKFITTALAIQVILRIILPELEGL
jgi:hypothetical protein